METCQVKKKKCCSSDQPPYRNARRYFGKGHANNDADAATEHIRTVLCISPVQFCITLRFLFFAVYHFYIILAVWSLDLPFYCILCCL